MNDFSVGSVLKSSFSIWLKNLIPFTVLAVIVYSPLVLYTLAVMSDDLTLEIIANWGYAMAGGGFLLGMIATAAMVYGVVQQLNGKPASLGACIAVGIKRLFPVLGVGLLVALCVGLGLIALIIPGIIISLMLYVAIPVAVIEKPGVMASLSRSKELTSGYKGSIFGILFVLGVIERIVNKVLESSFITETATMDDVKMYLFLVLAVSIVLGALGAVANAVVYYDLRRAKEGVGVEELARVFE